MGAGGGDRPIWFAGDRSDPVAAAIARRLPVERTRVVDAPGSLPRFRLDDRARRPEFIVLHRAILARGDLARVARLREWLGTAGRIILCVGPHARAVEVERWLGVVDQAIPDTLAVATIARHVAAPRGGEPAPEGEPTPVAVASTNRELRGALAALLRAQRFAPVEQAAPEDPESTPGAPLVWDVPALEPGWPERLARRCRLGPVVALIGFLNERDARIALLAGAVSCLDLPVDAADLALAVRQAAAIRRDPAHDLPPAPTGRPSRSRASRRPDRTGGADS